MNADIQYAEITNTILEKGVPIYNDRTGKVCHTIHTYTADYPPGEEAQLVTTAKVNHRKAFVESVSLTVI